MEGDELGGEVDHVVAEDALDAAFQTVFQPYQRVLLHALVQRQRQRAAADQAALVLEDELLDAGGALLQQVNGQQVLEVDLSRLRRGVLAEAGAAMVGEAFQIEGIVQLRQHLGLAGAGEAANDDEVALGDRRLGGVDEEVAQRLVAADHPRILDAGLFLQPLLGDLRAQAAAEAVQVAVGIGASEGRPGLDALGLERAGHQLVTQLDGGVLAVLLVAGTDLLPLAVVHQRQVDRVREGTLGVFHRGAHVHQRQVVEKDVAVVGTVGTHQSTSTAWFCRATSSPIGASARPSSAARARNSASPAGSTATSRPPLVCGSQSSSFCASGSGAMLSP
ncbi:hypothetical protein D3C80_1042630 [compost metagenome]